MRQLSVQPTTISEYSAYKQKYHEDSRFAQGINNKSADRFTLQTKRTVVASKAVCMFTISSARTERRASRVSFCQEELLWHKGRSRHGEGGQLRIQEGTKRSCNFTATLLVLLIFLTTEIATFAFFTEEQSARAVEVFVLGSFHYPPPSSLQSTRMITKAAWFSLCILSFVPYILTSLHVTTSTAIKAVDDNQSAN